MDQFRTIGQSPAPSLQSKTVGRAYAEKAAKTIFARYPNPKAGPEYLVELANCLADQSQRIVDRLADRHLGITAKHKAFPPAIGEVIDMIGAIHEMDWRTAHYTETRSRMQPTTTVRSPFRPYPKLWDAFADEPEVVKALDHAESFDWLTEASKRLAVRGKDAARKFIYPQPVDPREVKDAAA